MVNPTNSNAEGAIWPVSTWRGWAALIFCSLTIIEALSAFYQVFTGFSPYDDEGYFMISVKQFLDGHPLYTEVFSPYGPFYYLYEWVAFHITRTAVSHDSFRFLTLFAWLLIPLISAWSVYRITHSIPLSVVAQFAVFRLFSALSWEPGHPTELTEILVATGMLLVVHAERADQRRWALPCLGAVAAAVTLTKINVGGLFAIAVGLAFLARMLRTRPTQAIWKMSLAVAVVIPLVLTHQLSSQAWARNLALVVALSVVAAVLFIYKESSGTLNIGDAIACLLAATATAFLILLFFLVKGTSLRMLLDGLLIAPWHSVGSFVFPAPVDLTNVLLATVALSLALLYSICSRSSPRSMAWASHAAPCLKGVFGIVMLLAVFGEPLLTSTHWLIAHGTPFIFLLLLPEGVGQDSKLPFWRVAWCLIAVFQILQSFPVAGSDSAAAVFPMLLVAAICVSDFLAYVGSVLSQATSRVIARLSAATALLVVASFGIQDYSIHRARYFRNAPLDLPGAALLRVPLARAKQYQQMTSWLKASADTFVTLPGMYSFYFWTQQDPPSCRNLPDWMTLLSRQNQEEIVRVLEQRPRAAVIYSPEMVAFWLRPADLPQRTPDPVLINYIFTHFEQVSVSPATSRLGFDSSYRLMLRPNSALVPSSSRDIAKK